MPTKTNETKPARSIEELKALLVEAQPRVKKVAEFRTQLHQAIAVETERLNQAVKKLTELGIADAAKMTGEQFGALKSQKTQELDEQAAALAIALQKSEKLAADYQAIAQ